MVLWNHWFPRYFLHDNEKHFNTSKKNISCFYLPSLLVIKISFLSKLYFGSNSFKIFPISVSFLYTDAVSEKYACINSIMKNTNLSLWWMWILIWKCFYLIISQILPELSKSLGMNDVQLFSCFMVGGAVSTHTSANKGSNLS